MKHILFLTHYFPPEVNAPANRTYEHVIRWIARGYHVTVVTNNPNHPHGRLYPGYRNSWFSSEVVMGIRIIRVKTFLTPNRGRIRRSLNYVVYMLMSLWASCYIRSIDIVIATSPQFLCGIAGAIIAQLKSKPFLLEVRDLWPDSITAVNALNKSILVKLLTKMERAMYFSADSIITLTDAFKEHIIQYGYPGSQIVTITNGIDFQRHKITESLPEIFAKEGRYVISYIGTFGMAHKLITILETSALLISRSNIHFLLIGDGADRENLENFVSNHQLSNVTILPLQPKTAIPYFLGISDLGLIMLKNNALFQTVIPSKIFEYMAMSKPVIISVPGGEATRIVEHFQCGLVVDPENPEQLQSAILYLYNHPVLAARMGKRGAVAVRQYFNRDQLAAQMLRIIAALIRQDSARFRKSSCQKLE